MARFWWFCKGSAGGRGPEHTALPDRAEERRPITLTML